MISFIKSKPAIYVYVSCLNLITDFDHLWSFAMSWSSLLILKKSGFRSSKFAWSVWYETCDKYAKKKKKKKELGKKLSTFWLHYMFLEVIWLKGIEKARISFALIISVYF